ncbi:MAG: TonB-dependent receptor [Terracidiphilus sp.]|nr:TonB-dependent receptor [Terracidiphilus sp.]
MAMKKLSVVLLPALLLAGGLLAWTQATTGSISGRIADPQGNVLPGAHVTIQDVETGIVNAAVTNQDGEFIETALPPGHYTIKVELSGFATSTVPAFELNIDQKARFNIPMKVGAVTSSVVVSDSAPVLQVQGAETGQVIGTREIEDLPLEGRSFTGLMKLVPGVGDGGGGNNLNLSVNGQREFSNSVEVNGVEVTGNRNNDTNMVPSPDALQEFKLVTSAYAPEFGRASGGSVIVQTKSGANEYHGSALFFYRPTATAANNPFSAAGTTPSLEQKIYGASIGGPIKTDKAFLFLNFEGSRLQTAYSYLGNTPPVNQVKFDAAGDADLSGLLDPYSGNQIPIFDPVFFNNNYYSEQFPGNIIPENRVSPAGKQILLNLFPQPENNSFFTNFAVQQSYTDNNNVANLRSDYTFSQKNRVYLTYDSEQGDTSTGDPYAGHISIKGGGSADSGDLTSFENNSVAFTYDHVFSPTLLNEARASYFLSTVSQNSPLAGSQLAKTWDIQNVIIPGFPSTNNIPQIQFQSGPTVGGSTYKPLNFRDQNLTFVEALTWTRGRHNAKFGYEYRHLSSHPNFSLFPVPYQYYGGAGDAQTSDPTYSFYDGGSYYYNGGSEIADLLLGLPYVTDQGLQLTNAHTMANEHSLYVQDYWQITPKLNLTYGLRYEYQQPYVEANNNEANFNINTLLIDIAGRGGNPQSLVDSNKTDFMPRIGVSYQLLPTWVIRGGFGMFYSPENDAREDILTKNYPFFTQQQFVNYFDSGCYCFDLPYSLDAGVARSTSIPVASTVSTIDLTKVAGGNTQTVYSEPTNFPTAYSRNYNLTLEKQLGNATSVEIGYVGANTRNLSDSVGNYNVNNHLSANIGKVQTLLPAGISNYDSLQVKINRSFHDGYSLLASYTYAHGRDNGPAPFDLGKGGNYPQNPFNLGAEYANSDTDLRHHFSGSQIIELPFGHGKRFLSSAAGLGQAIIGGWQLNSITTLQTGKPFNVESNGSNPNYPGLRPNLVGSTSVPHRSIKEWFNPQAFAIPAGQSGSTAAGKTLIVGNAGRNILIGPGYTNEDMSLFKVFTLPREMKFQVRIEAFNLLNTAHYDNPVSNMGNANYNPNTHSAGNPQFGQITGGYSPRVMQFAGRFTF